MKKEKYLIPKMEFIVFMTEDVIAVSGSDATDSEASEETQQPVLPWD